MTKKRIKILEERFTRGKPKEDEIHKEVKELVHFKVYKIFKKHKIIFRSILGLQNWMVKNMKRNMKSHF